MNRSQATLFILFFSISLPMMANALSPIKKVDSLYNKAWDAVYKYPDSTLYYGQEQLKLAKEINYRLGMVNAHYILGYANDELNYFDVAAKEYYNGLALIENNQNYEFQRKKMLIYKCLGVAYDNTFGHELAVKYYSQALEIANKLGIKNNIAQLNYNVGYARLKLQEYSLAFTHLDKAKDIYLELGDHTNVLSTCNLIGVLYDHQEKFEEARKYYLEASDINSPVDAIEKGKLLVNLGENYFLDSNLDKALFYYGKALPIFLSEQSAYYSQLTYNNIGDVYLTKEQFQKSISFYKRSIALAESDVFDEEYKRANEKIALAYEHLGNYKEANFHKNRFIAQAKVLAKVKDNLLKQNSQYRMREMEWQLEKQLKDQEIYNMQRVNFWFKVSMSLLILILATAAFKAYRYYTGIKAVKKWLAS